MAPNLLGSSTIFLAEATIEKEDPKAESPANVDSIVEHAEEDKVPTYEWKIVWRNVLAFIYLHLGMLYGAYLILTQARVYTWVFGVVFTLTSALGVTAGAHRLWAHRCYKAKWQLRTILAILQTMAFQNHIYEWVRDHRVHHKFAETDADPHNAKRGFFFSHIGWLMLKKHKDVFEKGATVDMSDLDTDIIVTIQKKIYLVAMPLLCFVIPTWIPIHFWNEDPWVSWYVASVWRFTLALNATWLVNSAAHIWGNKPYDKNIGATDNKTVASLAMGEGWHNYHHIFPWDYKAAELGNYGRNFTTAVIDGFAKIGWAYDLKTVSVELIKKRVKRTGDGSHPEFHSEDKNCTDTEMAIRAKHSLDNHTHSHENAIWGWDDKDLSAEEKAWAQISHVKSE